MCALDTAQVRVSRCHVWASPRRRRQAVRVTMAVRFECERQDNED